MTAFGDVEIVCCVGGIPAGALAGGWGAQQLDVAVSARWFPRNASRREESELYMWGAMPVWELALTARVHPWVVHGPRSSVFVPALAVTSAVGRFYEQDRGDGDTNPESAFPGVLWTPETGASATIVARRGWYLGLDACARPRFSVDWGGPVTNGFDRGYYWHFGAWVYFDSGCFCLSPGRMGPRAQIDSA